MFTASIGSEQGPVEASVVGRSEQIDVCILTIRTKDRFGEFNLFRSGPLALEQILDLGYEIVNACRKLMPQVQEHAPDFDINDAVNSEGSANRPETYV